MQQGLFVKLIYGVLPVWFLTPSELIVTFSLVNQQIIIKEINFQRNCSGNQKKLPSFTATRYIEDLLLINSPNFLTRGILHQKVKSNNFLTKSLTTANVRNIFFSRTCCIFSSTLPIPYAHRTSEKNYQLKTYSSRKTKF